MTRVLLALCLLLPSSLSAATLTYELPFSLSADIHIPAHDDSFDPGFVERHYFGTDGLWWEVPAFDAALGTPIVLLARIDGILDVDITLTPPDHGIRPLAMLTPGGTGLVFVSEGPISLESHVFPESFPHAIPIGLDPGDTFISYPIASEAHIRVAYTGIATGTYLYDPVVTAIPEPLSLVFLGSGLAAGYYQRMRPRA